MSPEVAFITPMIIYLVVVVSGVDSSDDELLAPYLVCQIAGFVLYAFGIHYRYKRNGR